MRFNMSFTVLFFSTAGTVLGQYAYLGGAGLAVIDTATNQVVAKSQENDAFVSPDGTKVYAVGPLRRTIDSIALSTGQPTRSIPVRGMVNWAAFTPDGRTAYLAVNGQPSITVLDTSSDIVAAVIPVSGLPGAMVVSADGSKLYAATEATSVSGSLLVLSTASKAVLKTITLPSPTTTLIDPYGIDISPDGTRVYVIDNRQGILFAIDTASDTLVASVKLNLFASSVAVSPDGKKIYIVSGSGALTVIRPSDLSVIGNVAVDNSATGLSFTPNGAKLFVAGSGVAQVVDTATDTVTATIRTDVQANGYGSFIQKKLPAGLAVPPAVSSAVNGFSGAPTAAPGALVSIYGSNLATGAASFSGTLPNVLLGTSVQLSGQPIPLYYVSPGQINVQIPPGTPAGPATLSVTTGGAVSGQYNVTIQAAAPGIAFYNPDGVTRAAARNQDNSVNGPANAATAGSAVTLYLTGIGAVDNPVAAGQPAPNSPLSRAVLPVAVTVSGQTVVQAFSGLTPGSIGLAQVNITVPALPPGDYPVVVMVNGVASNAPVLSIK